jgi:hypothetical protein
MLYFGRFRKSRTPPVGAEHSPENAKETTVSDSGGAESGAFSGAITADQWAALPEALRAEIQKALRAKDGPG